MAPVLEIDDNERKKNFRRLKKQWKQEKLLKQLKKSEHESNVTAVECKAEQETARQVADLQTISIAVPGSILENAQSEELRTYLAGQIARAACIFKVDEVVVFDDLGTTGLRDRSSIEQEDGVCVTRPSCVRLAKILQYLECPQYLRKHFFPLHNYLNYAGVLNPLDTPHHLRQNDEFPFREGVVTNHPVKAGRGSMVNVGLLRDVMVDRGLTPGLRVTVKLTPRLEGAKRIRGTVVSPLQPRSETGIYWGYSVRVASSIGTIFSQAPYEGGYDLTIGTSDKGAAVDSLSKKSLRDYHHALVVFGGLNGLETALEADEVLKTDDPSLLFDYYLNTCPSQGSRTIRTEEAILISLAALRTRLMSKVTSSETSEIKDET